MAAHRDSWKTEPFRQGSRGLNYWGTNVIKEIHRRRVFAVRYGYHLVCREFQGRCHGTRLGYQSSFLFNERHSFSSRFLFFLGILGLVGPTSSTRIALARAGSPFALMVVYEALIAAAFSEKYESVIGPVKFLRTARNSELKSARSPRWKRVISLFCENTPP